MTQDPNPNPLAEARRAWHEMHAAESQLARLARYARKTPGMKDDQQRWSEQACRARETLQRVLGGAQ